MELAILSVDDMFRALDREPDADLHIVAAMTGKDVSALEEMYVDEFGALTDECMAELRLRGRVEKTDTGWDITPVHPVMGGAIPTINMRRLKVRERREAKGVSARQRSVSMVSKACNMPSGEVLKMSWCDYVTVTTLFRNQ